MNDAEPQRLRLDFNALRGRRAVSPLTYLIAGLGLFLSSFEFEFVLPGSSVGDALFIAATTTVASLVFLFIADKTVLRNRRVHPVPLALVLGVYVVVGILRAVVSSISAAAADAQGPELLGRTLAGIVLVVAWLSIIAIVLDYTDRDRATTMQLSARKAQLEVQREYFEVALAQGRSSIGELVDSVTEPAIGRSEELMEGVAADVQPDRRLRAEQLSALAIQMRDGAEGQVRSLSHMLASSEPQFDDEALVAPTPHIARPENAHWFRRALKQASVLDPIQPTAVTLTVLVEAIPLFTYVFGFRGLAQCALVGAALVFVFLVGARQIVTPRLRRWSQVVRILVLLGIAVAAGLLGTLSIYLWYSAERDIIVVIAFRCVWVFVIAMIVWAVIASSAAQHIRGQRELAATVAEIEWRVDALRAELHRVQKSASEIVHGRIQGRIVAAALVVSLQARRLERGQLDAAAQTTIALNEAADILREARDDVRLIQDSDVEADDHGIEELITAIAAAWRGVVDVDCAGDPVAFRAIDATPSIRSTVAEIVREAISNAAKHGAARSVGIRIAWESDSVTLTAVDDGTGVKGELRSGLGLGQIDNVGGAWTLKRADAGGGTVLRVVLPCPRLASMP